MKRRDFFKGITVAVLIPSVAKATDHGDLEGLSDDDHTQYFEKWGIKYWNQEMVDNVNFLLEKLNHVLDHPYTEFDVREWSSKNLKAKCAFDVTQAMTKLFSTTEQKVHALVRALSLLNETPPFTSLCFADTKLIKLWSNQLVQCAVMMLLVHGHNSYRRVNEGLVSSTHIPPTQTISVMLRSPISGAFSEWCKTLRARKNVVCKLIAEKRITT